MKYILGIVLALIAATVYFITRPQPEFVAGQMAPATATSEQAGEQESIQPDPAIAELEAKREAMSAEFEELKKARRNLESRLARMKAVTYGMEIPREEADVINEQMKNGYALLKNQRLMGAYSGAQDISDERARVEFINNYLQDVEEKFRSERR